MKVTCRELENIIKENNFTSIKDMGNLMKIIKHIKYQNQSLQIHMPYTHVQYQSHTDLWKSDLR